MTGKKTRGRQVVTWDPIHDPKALYPSFSKRLQGLYKKASELCTLCMMDIGVIVFSPTGKPYSFFHPSFESVVARYQNPAQPIEGLPWFMDSHSRENAKALNGQLDEVSKLKDDLKNEMKGIVEHDGTRVKAFWEEVSVRSLNIDQVNEWIALFEDYRARVQNRFVVINNGASGSGSRAPNQQQQQQEEDQAVVGVGVLTPLNTIPGQHLFAPNYNITGPSNYNQLQQFSNFPLLAPIDPTNLQLPSQNISQTQGQPGLMNPPGDYNFQSQGGLTQGGTGTGLLDYSVFGAQASQSLPQNQPPRGQRWEESLGGGFFGSQYPNLPSLTQRRDEASGSSRRDQDNTGQGGN